MTRATLRRLPTQRDRVDGYVVRGKWTDEATDVAIDMGTVPGDYAWWDLPLPACPDCGGELAWAEDAWVAGARACNGCGSAFTVSTRASP